MKYWPAVMTDEKNKKLEEEEKAVLPTKGSLLDKIGALEGTIERKSWGFLNMLHIELPHDPVVPPLDMYLKEMKTGVQTKNCTWMFIIALFTNSQEVETSRMSINWRMAKQNVVCPYNGIFIWTQKGVKYWCMLQHGWTLKTLCWAKEARHIRPYIVWFHQSRQIRRNRKQISGWEGGREWLLNGYMVLDTWFLFRW